MRRSLTKQERLSGREDIKHVFSAGRSFACKGLKLWICENSSAISRVVFSPSRQFPNAVARNAVKRRGKEIYRQLKYLVKPGYDLAFVFFPGEYSYIDRQEQIQSLLKRTRLLIQD
jgi:ribonuclease P protein component